MAASFNLTAQLNLRGPSNIRNIVSNIRRQLGTISGDINFNINPTTTRNVAQLNSALQGLNQTFAQTANAARNASTAIAAFSNAANAGNINNVATNLNNVSTAATNTAQAVTRASRQTAVARTEMEEFGRQSALAVRRFAAFSVSTGAIVSLSNAIRKGVAAFIEYDRQLVVLQQVTGESANGLAKLSSTVTSLATGLGVASADLLSVSSTLAQAGLSARDTERALKALALSALAPSFDNLNKTVEGSIALMRQFGISAGGLESALGSVNAVAAAFAVESADIIAAIQRTGGVFAAASKGVSEGTQALNEFIAIFTSVRQTTRESAETIATGLRTIFTRIQRGGTIEALKEFGVNLTDVEGKFVGAYRAVQLLSEGLNRIDPRDIKFSQIVEELGGFRQIGKVIPLIQQFATAQQALAVAQAGAGSLAEDAAIAQLSLANKITKVREEFLALFREIGSSDSFQTIAKGALDVASALIRVADSVKGVLPVLGIMLAMRGASAITQFGAGFIGGIRRGGGAAGLGNRAAGGFATGGYVPGSGNRDTVPAMLTPGEFVMRKKAVKQIGVGKLARLNRNGGGPVQYLNSGGVVQKFATGGVSQLAALSPGIGSSRIDKYIDDSKDIKKRKKNIQSQDMVSSTIVRRQITKKDIGDINQFRKNISQRTGLIQNSRGGNKYSVEGLAFENWLWDNIPYIKAKYNKAPKTYPLDLIPKAGARPAEIKFTGEQVPDPFILNKRLRYHLLNFGDRGGFTRKIDKDVRLGPTLVYELAPGLKDQIYYGDKGPSKSTLAKRGQRNLEQQEKLKASGFNRKNIGGYIQKLMAGQFVKPAKKPKTISPADLLVGPGGIEASVWRGIKQKALTAKNLTLGASGRTIIFPDGQEVDFKKALDANPNATIKTALSTAGIKPGELRAELTKLYSTQRADVVAKTGNRSPTEIAGARSQNLLFGIAGMFGRRFSPKPLNLTTADGLKQNTSAVVFGSVLDQDNIEKQARLASRKQRLEAINARRSDRGKQPLQDTTLIDRMVAPTAKELSGSFQKGAASTIARQNKKLAIDSVSAIASTLSPSTGGSKIFLDFDRTLSFGSDKIGAKTSKKKPDYSAFSVPSEVSAGLKNAKLSNLGSKLISIVGGLDSKSPGLGRELLRKMFVVSARPQNTMPLIARWLRNKGLRIPPSNVLGVGGAGVSPDAIAINKAEQMVKLGGGPGSVFIDDDPKNVSAARERGVPSVRYGFKLDKKDPLARQQAATEEGYQFEKFVNDNLPPVLKRAFFKAEGEGIDFPAGLDPQIAKYWFNDSRLVGVPVDTKRTVGGPSTIKDNVISYLKDKGYASGGLVQKFSDGMEVDYVPGSAMAALKAVAREFITPKSRKGGKRKVSFLTQKAVSLSKNIPPELLKEIEKEGRLVSGTGIGDLPRGDMGLVVDKIVNVALARVKKRKAGQLKKTEGALTFSAAGLQRGPRAPAGQMEKALAQYQKDPQYRAAMGLDSGVAGGFLKQFEALAKSKNFTSPKSLLEKLPGAKGQISEFRSSLQQQLKTATDPKEIKSLQDQIKKSTTALDDFDDYMIGGSPRNAGRASHFAWAMRQAVPDAARFATGGQAKPQKNFGQIALRTGSRIQATYIKDGQNTRSGQVIADKIGGNLFAVQSSAATKGYGPQLYDIVMEAATAQGGMLTSDRRTVSPSAKSVWDYYFSRRGDVAKVPLDPVNWTSNSRLIDPKLYGQPETWPPKNDPAWVLQTGYKKAPVDISNPRLVQRLSRGGSSKDTVDALVSNGEAYIPPKLAQKIGRSKLDKMNQADRNGMTGFSDGGISVFKGPGSGTSDSIRTTLPVGAYILREKATKALGLSKGGSVGGVQKFAVGGAVDTAVAAMSPKDAARLKASIAKNAQAFEQLERLVAGFPVEEVQASLKSLARSLDKGVASADALNKATLTTAGPPAPGAPSRPGAVREAPKDRVGTAGRPADMGTSKIFTDRANFEANKAKTIVDIQAYEKSEYDKARKQGKTAQEARQSSKTAAIARATQLAQPMSEKQEKFIAAQARGRAKQYGANDDDAQRAGQNALNKARAKKQAQLQAAAIFNTASITGDQTALRNTLNATPPPKRSDIVSKFGSFGAGRLDAAQSYRDMSARAAAARAPSSASSFSALAGKDKAGLGDALGVLGNKIKNLNLSALQKFGTAMATVNTKLAQGGQAITTLRTSLANTGGAFSRFSTTLKQNPFKAIQQVAGGVSGAFGKITTALSTATAAVTAFGKRTGTTPPPGGGPPDGPDRPDRPSAGQRLQNAAFGLSFAIPMIADMMTVADPKNAQQAATNAQMTGISTAVGSATMLASMGPLGMIAAIPTAVGGIVKAFADAKNAAHEFNKQAQSTKLEEALEKAGTALDNYSKNVKDTAAAEKARAAVLKANQEARTLSTMQQEPRASMVGMVADYFGAVPQDNMAMQRSQILEQKGIMSYLGSIGFGGGDAANTTAVEFRSLIPQLAKENAKTFQGAAEASTRFLETQFKSGQTVDSMAASGQLNEFGRSLALADVKVQEYMMAVDNTVGLSDAQKNAMKENIIATQTEAKAREIQTRALREKALETLNRQTTQLQNSLERMFQNMEQAINSNAYSLSKLSDSAELTAASLSGAARAGTVRVDAINALNNPRGVSVQQRNAAVTQAASMFGSQAPEMEGVLKLSGMLENTLMSTINNTIKAANASGTAVTQEAIGAKLESSINQALSDLQLPPELATGLSREVKDAVQKMRTSDEDQVDFSEIINQVPQLGRVLESSRRAQELANKALEYWQQNLNEYANAMNNLVETQVDINSRLRRSTDILISGQLALGKALGQSVSLQTSVALIDQKRAAQTPGGVTDPNAIAMNIRNLETLRSTQEAQAQEAAQKGFGGKDEFVNMQNNLANTNLALRENYASLKDMSENTDKANAAMERISELRAKTQAGVGIAERLVTSSPQELANLNRSMALLNNNMRGGMNVGSTAEDRKGVLDVFNMIAPFLGERQDGLKANVLESMLRESGIGVNNMMQGVLDSLRNPAGDPQMAQAINIYNQGVNEQVKANQQLANLALIMNENNAEIAAQKIATAIQGVQLSFETQTLSNINDGIQQLVGIAQQKPPGNVAGTLARGGIVYAAEGQHINFKTKGTDTVPAMLTPGEFVVNRSATQKNLPLLQSINNGYQRGGKVSYYQDGGLVFGRPWGLNKNMDAQTEINAGSEMVSDKNLSGLDWPKLMATNGNIPKNSKAIYLSNIPYYAGTATSTNLIKEDFDKDKSGIIPKLKWYPGIYPDGFRLERTGLGLGGLLGTGFNRSTVYPSKSGGGQVNILDVPNLEWIDSIKNTPKNLNFKQKNQQLIIDTINKIFSSIPTISKQADSIIVDGRSITTVPPNEYSIGSNPTASYSAKIKSNGIGDSLEIKNLSPSISDNSNNYLIDDIETYRRTLAGVDKTSSKAQPVAATINRSSSDYFSIGTGPASDLYGNFSGPGANFGLYDPLWTPIDLANSLGNANIANSLEKLIQLKADLKNSLETVKGSAFKESSVSINRKNMINKMRNLLRGSSFQEMFDPSEIAGGVPTTLFNLPADIWFDLAGKFNSPRGTYATENKSNWIPIGPMDADGFFTSIKSFPWIRQGFREEDLNSIMNRKKELIERVGDLVKFKLGDYTKPGISFPYKQITGPLWNDRLGTFADNPSSFTVVDDFTGDLNPFKGLQLDPTTQAILADGGLRGGIDGFVRQILDSNDKTGKFKLNIARKLSPNSQFLNKADYTENTKSNAFINQLTKTMEFEPVEYQKVLDREKEKQRVAQREQMVGQAAGVAQQAANFDAAKRVALGRLTYAMARKSKVPMRFRPPEKFDDLSMISEALQQTIPNVRSDYVRTITAGTKLIFDNLKTDDGSFFLQNGIDINSATLFDPAKALRKKIRQPDGSFVDKIYDYRDLGKGLESKITDLILRSGFQQRIGGEGANKAAGGGLTAIVSDEDKAGLNLKGIKIERVNLETGKLEEKPFIEAGDQVLKWGNLFDAAFNPYAQFPNVQGRQSLFSLFKEKFSTATMPGTRRPAFDKRLSSKMNEYLKTLSNWYLGQDYFINTQDTPDISTQKKTRLQNIGAAQLKGPREKAQEANLFYTNNRFGELPTYEWLQAKLDQKINPADAQVKNAVGKATGGLIYASDGALINFQPRGTDTVPAMLTPGEFVVNRESTKKHLPLLKNINMATGGVVQYRQNGGAMYNSNTGTFSRSEGVADQILSKVESGNKINEFTYGNTNKNLAVSRNTNTLAGNINEDTSKLRSSVKNATGYASGGMIYANNGMLVNFQPKGTDTVPAMLSPGEFVVRREATQKHLSLLHAINNNTFSGDSALTLNKGGYIQPAYLRAGGFGIPSLASLPDLVSKMAGGIQSAVEKAITQAFNNIELPSSENNTGVSSNKEIATQIGTFANNLSNLANRLESISVPPEITITGKQDINVNANGLQVLSSLNPSLGTIALNMIKTAIDNLATKNPGTLDFNIEYPQGQ